MQFIHRYLIRFFPFLILSLFGLPAAAATEVDATRACQTIDGFGASSAWINGKITADLATVFWQDDTLDGHIGLSLSGLELMRKSVPRGCRSVVIEDRHYSGIVLARTLQNGIVQTSPLVLTR